jgi:hypothetical protein
MMELITSLLDSTGETEISKAVTSVLANIGKYKLRWHLDNEALSGDLITKDLSD